MKKSTLKAMPLDKLIQRIENADDFNYDDETVEVLRRGYKATWVKDYTKKHGEALILTKI